MPENPRAKWYIRQWTGQPIVFGIGMKRPHIGVNGAYILPCVLAILVISALGFTAGQLVGSDPNTASTATSTFTYETTVKGKVIHMKAKVRKIVIPASTKVVHGRTVTIPASTSVVTSPGQVIRTTRVIHTPGGTTVTTRTQTNTTTLPASTITQTQTNTVTSTVTNTATSTVTLPTTITVTITAPAPPPTT